MEVGGGGDDDEVARRRVGRRRWEIECIEPGMEEIRQIMLSRNGRAGERQAGRPPNSTENINQTRQKREPRLKIS